VVEPQIISCRHGISFEIAIPKKILHRSAPAAQGHRPAHAILANHTTPREAGMGFSQTKPELAAYTHLAFLAYERIPASTSNDLVAETKRTYNGSLEVG